MSRQVSVPLAGSLAGSSVRAVSHSVACIQDQKPVCNISDLLLCNFFDLSAMESKRASVHVPQISVFVAV